MRVAPGSVPAVPNENQKVVVTPANWRILFGVAGLVSEQLAEGHSDSYEVVVYIENCRDFGEISDSDLSLMGDDWGYDEVEAVIGLLTDHWDSVKLEAAELMREAVAGRGKPD